LLLSLKIKIKIGWVAAFAGLLQITIVLKTVPAKGFERYGLLAEATDLQSGDSYQRLSPITESHWLAYNGPWREALSRIFPARKGFMALPTRGTQPSGS
jgi:hypothetical protein